jgi:CRISPR/Cas system CSM-associated protein Csm3 (group 7 of RAMP superfamily)
MPDAPFSYRPFRVEIRGALALLDPLHIGAGERLSLSTDAPILLDPATSAPYIPGTSLRGALRDHLEREAGLLGCDRGVLKSLFGKTPERDSGEPSWSGRLSVFDAYLSGPVLSGGLGDSPAVSPTLSASDSDPSAPNLPREVRDHVRLHPGWGAAESGGKFDFEVALPRDGWSFGLQIVYEGDSAADAELVLLQEAVRLLTEGEFRLGAKSGWGHGRVQLQNPVFYVFDRSTCEGVASYLASRMGQPPSPAVRFPSTRGAQPASAAFAVPFSSLTFQLRLHFEGPVLVKAPIPPLRREGGDPADPETYAETGLWEADHVFLHRLHDDQCYLPGSSLRGVLRSQALRIDGACGTELTRTLFGRIKSATEDGVNGLGAKGLIEVSDGALAGPPHHIFLDHVAIDRITAAAVDSKKFSQSALASPKFDLSIRIQFAEGQGAVVRLAAFLLRDLMGGRLWAGSGVARGYGYIKSADMVSLHGNLLESLQWRPPAPVTSRPGRALFELIGPFQFHDPALAWLWESLDSSMGVSA